MKAMEYSLQHFTPTTMIIAFFAFFFFLYYILLWRRSATSKSNKNKNAPEVGGAWPIVGHLPLLVGPRLLHCMFGAMADKYGPALTIRLGLRRALVVSSWEVAKECFTTNDKAFAYRPSSLAVKIMGYNNAMFGFSPYGPYWRELRKISTLELLSNHRLELHKHVRATEVDICIKELYQVWAKNRDGIKGGGVLVEMKEWLGDLTLNVAVRMVVGKRYFGASAACEDEEEARQCQKAFRDLFVIVGLFLVSDFLPLLGWLDVLQGHNRAMKRTAKELDCLFERWLEEHRRNKLLRDAQRDRDFMDVLMSTLEDAKLFGHEADVINKATCMALILGGSDTTMVTLTWALSLLLNNRHTLKKAQDEIDFHVGKDRPLDEADVKKLVYLQAIVKETLRLYPGAPLSAPHEAIKDCTVVGYHVPAGTRLITNIWKIQRDPRVWSNPSDFQPERFLTNHANLDVRGHHFELIPFGSGRRACPGVSFGLQVVHLTLARLMHAFEFATSFDAPVDMTESAGLTNLKLTPLDVLITPRLPLKLYE